METTAVVGKRNIVDGSAAVLAERRPLDLRFSQEDSILLENLLKESMRQIVKLGRQYELVVGDDTSGRLPTLVVRKVLSEFAPHKGKKLPTIFISGNWKESDDNNKKIIGSISKTKKALLVTEAIESASTLAKFKRIFDASGVSFDVVTLMASHEEDYYKKKMGFDDKSHLFIGTISKFRHTSFLHARSDLTGLNRFETKESHSINAIPSRGEGVGESVAQVRKEIGAVASKITEDLRAEGL